MHKPPDTLTNVDKDVEEKALREHGMLGRTPGMSNMLFAMDYSTLPAEAMQTIDLIISGGPFPFPKKDGSRYGNRSGDLPSSSGVYLEFTVPTPGAKDRGARRIVAHRTGVLFFTACHYERVPGGKGIDRVAETAKIDEQWRNGFYIITGMPSDLRHKIATAVKAMQKR